MPKSAFGFDADNAAHEALKAKVLADREAERVAAKANSAKLQAEKEEAARERRRSLGLPEEENKGWRDRMKERKEEKRMEDEAHVEKRKSISEKIANLVFNAGRKVERDGI
ncbi:hypothetical protein H2198_003802 [Neophaeococcomyces mojaviensis]|uniref:Uncharacterized protein n=1 Tax=Neophaeococcomyces mojaviensis TaxID=3383035 RepID=A0ACC3AAS1_9EURO|nr:hypothetical protein H2198_003802 [Knufia sp. JES_112]